MRLTHRAHVLLGLLLLADGLFIAADILQRHQMLHDIRFLVTQDRGYGELFQYAKAGAGCFLLLLMARRRRSATALTWAGLLALVLMDDSLQLHERAGDLLGARLGLPAFGTLRSNQVGELLFYGALGVATLGALGYAWSRADAEDRALSRRLFGWFAALGFCAVVLDAVDSLMRKSTWATDFALLEDGGEMVVLSFLTATVWSVFERQEHRLAASRASTSALTESSTAIPAVSITRRSRSHRW